MLTRLIPMLLCLTACASTGVDTISLAEPGPLSRQVERVLSRHDSYVIGDLALPAAAADEALRQSDGVRSLGLLPEVRRDVLLGAFAPVMDRHDAYVGADATLDDLRRGTYLAATGQLRRLLAPSE